MSRVIYVDGHFAPWGEASVHAEDRGFQFGDAVYEVCEVARGHLVDETRHIARLERSLKELDMAMPMSAAALARVMRETVRRNRVRDGILYLQVSRGVGPRDFLYSGNETLSPTLVCLARSVSMAKVEAQATVGIAVKTMPDIRWGRCDIKTVMLLPSVLAKEAAKADGGKEAWLVDRDGKVTEGASSNAWIIDASGRLVTRQADRGILRGVTRTTVIDLLGREGMELVERPFTVAEAKQAREAFITSATNTVMPVVRIDETTIGDGKPGPFTRKLRAEFHSVAEIAP